MSRLLDNPIDRKTVSCCNLAHHEDGYYSIPTSTNSKTPVPEASVSDASLMAPSKESLGALRAVYQSASVMSSKDKKSERAKIISKWFNPVANRPYPSNHISLEQSIRVESESLLTAFTTSVAVGTYTAVAVTLSGFAGLSAYTGLFDQYRFDVTELWLEPQVVATSGGATGYVASCVDLDDANTPTTFNSVAAHQGAMVGGGGVGHYHRWKPHMAIAAYSGAFTSYANDVAGWIDCASPNVQHFGVKIAAFPTAAAAMTYLITVRAVISFRSPGIA